MTSPINLLLTGPIGVGKSTVCGRVIAWAQAQGYRVGGVWTPALLDELGNKTGITLVNLASGERRTLARVGRQPGALQLGKYAFDPTVLAWGCEILESAPAQDYDLLVIDEIGRLELEQGRGFCVAFDLLGNGQLPRTISIVRESLREAVYARLPGVRFDEITVTEANRDAVAETVIARLFPA